MRTIKEKVLLNFGSTVLPMTAGLLAVPILIEKMGIERFGLLSIVWMIVGYFGVLDMGLGRALTQRIASNLGAGKEENIKPVIYFSLKIVLAMGLLSSLLIFLFSEYIIFNVFDITDMYLEETKYSMYWVALVVPLAVLSTALFGVLEGFQYFGWIALIRLPSSIMMFVSPLIALYFSDSLDSVAFSLFVVRFVFLSILMTVLFKILSGFVGGLLSVNERKSLISFGGWVTLSNLISPVMIYFDRFYIASILGASLVAYYTTPLDFLVKATLIPLAVIGVMFSYFSNNWEADRQKVVVAYKKTMLIIFGIMFVFLLVVYFGAEVGISLWISEEFASESYLLAQIIALGIFFNGIAMVPFALVQSAGRADLTAKFHLMELPIFIVLLIFGVKYYGLIGAAWAWTVRVILDCILLNAAAYYTLRDKSYA